MTSARVVVAAVPVAAIVLSGCSGTVAEVKRDPQTVTDCVLLPRRTGPIINPVAFIVDDFGPGEFLGVVGSEIALNALTARENRKARAACVQSLGLSDEDLMQEFEDAADRSSKPGEMTATTKVIYDAMSSEQQARANLHLARLRVRQPAAAG